MGAAEAPIVLPILEEALGAGYVNEDELRGYALHEGKAAFVAAPEGRVSAVATGFVVPSNELLDALPADQRPALLSLVPELRGGAKTGLLKSVAVDPTSRKGGLGTAVCAALVQELTVKGAAHIVSIGWTDKDGCHIQGPLEALGFRPRGDLLEFWRGDSILHGYSCPTCSHPCRCTARVFFR